MMADVRASQHYVPDESQKWLFEPTTILEIVTKSFRDLANYIYSHVS